jgi:hypothetical protein
VCRACHRLIHHAGWDVKLVDGRPEFYPPPWIDPNAADLRHRGEWEIGRTWLMTRESCRLFVGASPQDECLVRAESRCDDTAGSVRHD